MSEKRTQSQVWRGKREERSCSLLKGLGGSPGRKRGPPCPGLDTRGTTSLGSAQVQEAIHPKGKPINLKQKTESVQIMIFSVLARRTGKWWSRKQNVKMQFNSAEHSWGERQCPFREKQMVENKQAAPATHVIYTYSGVAPGECGFCME